MANGQLIADRSPAVAAGTFYRLNVIDNLDGTCTVYIEDRLNSDGVSTPGAVTATGLQVTSPTGGVSGSGTINRIPKFTAASTIGNSSIADNGTSISATEPWAAGGLLITDLSDSAGALILTYSETAPFGNFFIGKGNVVATAIAGTSNTSLGQNNFANLAGGNENTAIGQGALNALVSGSGLTAIGAFAGLNALGAFNTFVGDTAGQGAGGGTATGDSNTAIGRAAFTRFTSGQANISIGVSTGDHITSGSSNVIIGNIAGRALTTTGTNVIIGTGAGNLATGTGNVMIGNAAGAQQVAGDNKLYIANTNTTTPLIGGDFSAGSLQFNGSAGITNYKGRVTAGAGLASIRGFTSQKAETNSADANVLTVTPPAVAGTYRVEVVISVSSATNGVISWTLSYKDSNGNAVSAVAQQIFQQGTAAPNTTFTTSAAGNYYGSVVIDIDNSATNIVVGWVGGGTSAAKMSASIEQLN